MNISKYEQRVLHALAQGGQIRHIKDATGKVIEVDCFNRDGFRLAIMSAADAPRPAGACGLGFEAPDWEDAGRRLADRGLRADEEEDPVSGVRLLWFEDPEGRPLYFWQLIGDAAEG